MPRGLTTALCIVGGLVLGAASAFIAQGNVLTKASQGLNAKNEIPVPAFYVAYNAQIETMDTAHAFMVVRMDDPYNLRTEMRVAVQYNASTTMQKFDTSPLTPWQLHAGDNIFLRFPRKSGPFVASGITQLP